MSKSTKKKPKISSGIGDNKTKIRIIFDFLKSERFRKIRGVFYILFSLFLFVVMISYLLHWKQDETAVFNNFEGDDVVASNVGGTVGAKLGNFFVRNMFGITSFGFTLLFVVYGFRLLSFKLLPFWKTFWITLYWMIWGAVMLGYINSFVDSVGLQIYAGSFGIYIAEAINGFIGKIGTGLLLVFSMILYLVFVHNLHFKATQMKTIEDKIKDGASKIFSDRQTYNKQNNTTIGIVDDLDDKNNGSIKTSTITTNNYKNTVDNKTMDENIVDENFVLEDIYNKDNNPNDVEFEINDTTPVAEISTIDEKPLEETSDDVTNDDIRHYGLDEPYDPTLELHDYKLPSIDMLINYEEKNTEVTKEELLANKNKIVETLKNYSIDIVRITASPGPTVTLYEIVPAPGIKISKIKNLEDDIALSLAALGIRIIAPIPGKGTIGIEVPNTNPQIVSMRTMLTSDKFLNNKFELPIAIGKTISNEPYVADLAKMPHLLMAGATGQGKSVGLNAIIASLLYKKHPAELKFIMVDPKKVELSLYNKIERHYLAKLPDSEEAIITDTRKVVRTLNSLCIEMDARYDLLKKAQVRNIKEYNPKFIARRLNPENGHRYLPYIVVVVDEFADLIMTAGKEVEHPIARIAQLARAVGIHLIIATQRPSVNIITGTIKANFPARIAFRVTSKIDSRTILDTGGAEQLIGRGDMLLSSGSEIVRLQCALIDTEEIEQVADYIGSQRGYPECFLLPEYIDEESEPSKEFDPKQKDEFFEDAARLVVASQHGSTSLLQRKLQLGYNRAGRIIDQLEAAGVVGPFEGSKAREVLIKTEAELIEHLKNMNM